MICSGATMVASINHVQYTTRVTTVEVENQTLNRVLVKLSGVMEADASDSDRHLPFVLRY